jgi:hypothetical protein
VSGWLLHSSNNQGDMHVVPRQDLRSHLLSLECWCKPVEDIEEPGLWVHNALDQREKYESGELKLQ